MIDIFKKHAPAYKRLVRKYALDVWKNRADQRQFMRDVERYKKRYERDLVQHYRDEEIKIYPGTIRATANQWYVDQKALADTIEVIAKTKKDNLTEQMFDELRKSKGADVQKMLNRAYLEQKDIDAGASVYKVFSFSENLEDKAEQLGEQAAFELGAEVNHAVMTENHDSYTWNTQEDSRVRKTHRKLNGKTFAYEDPPTTIDKYGHTHTGHPGTDWGCRCFETEPTGKVLRKYVVRE